MTGRDGFPCEHDGPEALEAAAFAIAHIAGCDEPNSNARVCEIAKQIAWHQDGCECLNMARAALGSELVWSVQPSGRMIQTPSSRFEQGRAKEET